MSEPSPGATTGPLAGVRVVELAALAPVSMAAMMLADYGAEVTRIDPAIPLRMLQLGSPADDLLRRGRRSIALDLTSDAGREVALALVERADVLIEGFRPGVCERLGLSSQACLGRNPALVFARLTGWGQDGPLATTAGHDISYLALTGALAHGCEDGATPQPFLNFVGDFGAGTMLAVVGVLAALHSARATGRGQVVDAAMVDGIELFSTHTNAVRRAGRFDREHPERNFLQGAAPFYRTYRCADGRFITVAAAEPTFYERLCEALGLEGWEDQWDHERWPERRTELAARFAERSRDEWWALLESADACVAPVLSFDEARRHPHLVARRDGDGRAAGIADDVPSPAPRFSATPNAAPSPPRPPGADTVDILRDLGYDDGAIRAMLAGGAAATPSNGGDPP